MNSTDKAPQNSENNRNNSGDFTRNQPLSESSSSSVDAAGEWNDFMLEHADEFDSIAHSSSARRFERAAQKHDRRAAAAVKRIQEERQREQSRLTAPGPRDYTTSWLDADQTLDSSAPFEEPNPDLGSAHKSTILFISLCTIGVLGLVAVFFVPSLAAVLSMIFGACLLIGGFGLLTRLPKRHSAPRNDADDPFGNGARV